jgi:peptidoglycan/xylan/chitin deacetylase (PgdA/CDA1 family)
MKWIPLILLFFSLQAAAQREFKWPKGKKSAIILTYDDALVSQLDNAIPQLKTFELTGTFFLDGRLKPEDRKRWTAAAKNGNELANHSFYHPCPEASYKAAYYAEGYTVSSMVAEIGRMNQLLASLDGKRLRTYAYPCGRSLAGGEDYTESLINAGFIKYARAGSDRKSTIITDFKKLDFFKVPSWGLAAKTTAQELIGLVKDNEQANGMAVFMFHGIGGDYIDVSASAHEELLKYLASHQDIWVATFQEVLDYVKKQNLNK